MIRSRNDDDDNDDDGGGTNDPLKNVGDLGKSPLNTVLLCYLWEDFEGVLPASRTQLYVQIVLFVLRKNEEKNGLESSSEHLISVYRKELLLLGSFAFESLLKGEISSRGGTGYAGSLRGNAINFRGNTLTPVTSYISLT